MNKKQEVMKEAKMLCPYCENEFTPDMQFEYLSASSGCDSCGYGAVIRGTVVICCEHCGKVVYKKEFDEDR